MDFNEKGLINKEFNANIIKVLEIILSLCKKIPKHFISTSSIHRLILIFDLVIPIIILKCHR